MRDHLAYLKYVLRHKYHVFLAGRMLGVSIKQLILHDASKFSRREWGPYVKTFYAPDGSGRYEETDAFNQAWNAHQKTNLHHWQYWLLQRDEGNAVPLDIPEIYIREMVADWIGASLAIRGYCDVLAWYERTRDGIKLSDATRTKLENILQLTCGTREKPLCAYCHLPCGVAADV